jgi:hypothetical protein
MFAILSPGVLTCVCFPLRRNLRLRLSQTYQFGGLAASSKDVLRDSRRDFVVHSKLHSDKLSHDLNIHGLGMELSVFHAELSIPCQF